MAVVGSWTAASCGLVPVRMRPRSEAGREAVKVRGLFGGETEERAGRWVRAFERHAADQATEALRAVVGRLFDADARRYLGAKEETAFNDVMDERRRLWTDV